MYYGQPAWLGWGGCGWPDDLSCGAPDLKGPYEHEENVQEWMEKGKDGHEFPLHEMGGKITWRGEGEGQRWTVGQGRLTAQDRRYRS